MKGNCAKLRTVKALLVSGIIICGIAATLFAASVTAFAIAPDPTYYTTRQGNPYLPLWEYIPDGEPYVFEDPDNPGKYRAYVYGSHDMMKTGYCGWDIVTWSAPVDDLTNWRYDGIIFESVVNGAKDVLYAPDVAESINKETGKKTYYLYPNNMNGARQSQVAKSDRPDGPFETINWNPSNPTQTIWSPSGQRFDPAVLVDDDGRAYMYWGGGSSRYGELEPNMTDIKSGTQVNNPFPTSGTWRFNEASSIRKVGNTYVFVYARGGAATEPTGSSSNAQLAYGYSQNPLGPYTYGGIIVDCAGETVPSGSSYSRTFNSGNTHGGICQINGQWYVFFHRNLHTYARQAMVAPIDLKLNEDGSVVITAVEGSTPALGTAAEVTSNGFYLNGLDPYRRHSWGIACYIGTTARPSIRPAYDKSYEGLTIYDIKNNATVGIKYFNFDKTATDGKHTRLELGLQPLGVNAQIEVFLRSPKDTNTTNLGELLGTINLTANMPQEYTTFSIPTTRVDEASGKYGLFLRFSGAPNNTNICELHDMRFYIEDKYFEDDFKNGLTYWTTNGNAGINNDALTLAGENAQAINKVGKKWSDYSMETDIGQLEGTLNVRFRQSDANNYYELAVSKDKLELYSALRGKKALVKAANFNVGAGPFKLTVDAVGDLITARINGMIALTASNDDHEIGSIGYVSAGGSVAVGHVVVGYSAYTPPPIPSEVRADSITIDGAPLPGFSPDTYNYSFARNPAAGVPVIGAASTDRSVKVSMSQIDKIPGTAVVRFTDRDGTSTYLIKFYSSDMRVQSFAGLTQLPEDWMYAHNSETAISNVTFEATGIKMYCNRGPDYPVVVGGTHPWPAIQRTDSLRGDWRVDVKIRADKVMNNSGLGTSGGYQQYGLGLQSSSGSYCKFVMMNAGTNQVAHVAGAGDAQVTRNGFTTNYMRWEKTGNVLTAYHSGDGVNYVLIAQGSFVESFYNTARLQIFATLNSGNTNYPYTIWAESITYTNLGDVAGIPDDQLAVEKAAALIGNSVLIPRGAYEDAAATAAKATETINAMTEIKALGVTCTVEPSGSGYAVTYKKGLSAMRIDFFTIVVFSADWASLRALLDTAEALSEYDYTLASWNKFANALRGAQKLNAGAGDLAASYAYSKLAVAMGALEKINDGGVISVIGSKSGGYGNADKVTVEVKEEIGLETQTITILKGGKVVKVIEKASVPADIITDSVYRLDLDLTQEGLGEGAYKLVADLYGNKYSFTFATARTCMYYLDDVGSGITANAANFSGEEVSGTAIVAIYNKNRTLAVVETRKFKASVNNTLTIPFGIDFDKYRGEGCTYKVFFWGDALNPLSAAIAGN